ncbi:thioredoxin domain-containing protein [Nitrososphaera viennensis]|nr:thioredoxin domain-containing protein [Nitrososphaera viennensis]UVS70185.1 thioredoxin domain-containing protein [Nitrososphaera viennensis]
MHDDHSHANSGSKPNKLVQETSPYLLQHAYNPVEWYAWGEEALERAKKEDKPIFLSVGYSACHWCHVMAHESFEDEETAKIMNEHFINIKVDREERPDIDDIYQRVCQLATGTGGWPLSVFLTPNQKPFYVGTYFPKEGRQYNLPGFKTILQQLAVAYKSKKNEVEMASAEFMDALSQTARDVATLPAGEAAKADIERSILDEAAMGLLQMGDTIYGGFGQAPKFPNASNLLFLLRYYDISGINRFRDFVVFTADKMAQGGIHDQLGGGFARYSTDQKWLVPHFEKMLYDNALLAQLYAELFQITKDGQHLAVLRKTLDFVIREMTHPEGGFYSAQDADSEGEEGKFYLWTKKEIREILQDQQLAIDAFCERYGVTEGGNFEFKNILNVRSSVASIAQRYGRTPDEITRIIEDSSARLFAAREKRVRPGRDEKVLTSWNGLMISGFAKGYAVTGDARYLDAAKSAVRFIESRLVSSSEEGRLMRTFKDGQSKLNAYLDDYAFYVSGLLDLFAVDSRPEYLEKAARYTEFMVKHFWDDKEGNLFFTSDDHEQLIVRTKSFYDLAIPSGNSVAASNLLRLYHYTQNNGYLDKAIRIMKSGARPAAENPFGFGQLLIAIYLYVKKPVEVTVIGKGGSMSGWLKGQFLPDGITAFVSEEKDLPALQKYTFFQGRNAEKGETAFVCRNFTCSLPITTEKELARQLGRR